MSATNAEYNTAITTIRGVLGSGGALTGADHKLLLRVIQDAVSRLSTIKTTVDAQFVILQAKGTADASAEIDTADTAVHAVVSVPTYASSTVADG